MIGVYGVLACSVARRTHELGIRAALGAGKGSLLGLVVRQGLGLTITGVIAGLAAAYAVTRLLSSLVYGTTVTDPAVFLERRGTGCGSSRRPPPARRWPRATRGQACSRCRPA